MFLDSSSNEQTQWYCDRQFHVAGKVMSVDERSKGRALR